MKTALSSPFYINLFLFIIVLTLLDTVLFYRLRTRPVYLEPLSYLANLYYQTCLDWQVQPKLPNLPMDTVIFYRLTWQTSISVPHRGVQIS